VHPAFSRLLERVAARVRKASALRQRSTIYAVPPTVYGFPYYDAEEAAEYLGEELAARGYAVTLHGSGVMAISWASAPKPARGGRDVYDIDL
jgi:hypothetical protein